MKRILIILALISASVVAFSQTVTVNQKDSTVFIPSTKPGAVVYVKGVVYGDTLRIVERDTIWKPLRNGTVTIYNSILYEWLNGKWNTVASGGGGGSGTLQPHVAGFGLLGFSYDGSAPVTWLVDTSLIATKASINVITGNDTITYIVDSIANAPLGTETNGTKYLVGTSPTGTFSGHASQIATLIGGVWSYQTPLNQQQLIVDNANSYATYQYNGTYPTGIWKQTSVLVKVGGNKLNATLVIGTLDKKAISFKTNGKEVFRINPDSSIVASGLKGDSATQYLSPSATGQVYVKPFKPTVIYTNSNIGAGYRWAVPNTNNIKTIFAGTNIIIDSTTNANGLTINSTASGSGSTNSNVGAGFRLAIPNTNNIKTLFGGYGILNDSASNTNGITSRVDTALLSQKYATRNYDDSARNKARDSVAIIANSKVASVTAGTGISVTGTATNPIINATGGGGGSGDSTFKRLTWINAQDFGILPSNSAATNTTNFTTAINFLIAKGGGTIYFQYADSAYLGTFNIPAISPSLLVPIKMLGASQPPVQMGTVGGPVAMPTKGSTLKSLDTTAGNAVIKVAGTSFNGLLLDIENLNIATYNKSKISGIDATYAAQFIGRNLFVNTNIYNVQSGMPISGTFGISLPTINNGAINILDNVNINSYYDGLIVNEHTYGNNVNVNSCWNAINIYAATHSSVFSRVCLQRNHYNIRGSGVAYVYFDNIDIEQVGAGQSVDSTDWQKTVYDFNDSLNLIRGFGSVLTVLGGVGTSHSFTKNGGNRFYNYYIDSLNFPILNRPLNTFDAGSGTTLRLNSLTNESLSFAQKGVEIYSLIASPSGVADKTLGLYNNKTTTYTYYTDSLGNFNLGGNPLTTSGAAITLNTSANAIFNGTTTTSGNAKFNASVGIGVTPSYPFEISLATNSLAHFQSTNNNAIVYIDAATSKDPAIIFQNATVGKWTIKNTESSGTSDRFSFLNSAGTEVVSILQGGNVGINTSIPFSTCKLQVKVGTDQNFGWQPSTTFSGGVKMNTFNDVGSLNVPMELNGSVLGFKTGETMRAQVDASGNFNLTTVPATNSETNPAILIRNASTGNVEQKTASAIAGSTTTLTGNGGSTTVTLTLPASATWVMIGAQNAAAAGISYWTLSGTTVTVNYSVAPTSGTNNCSYWVQYK